MSTTTEDTTAGQEDLIGDAQRAADHADAASLAVIRPEQQRFDENQRAILRQLGIEDATDGDLDLFFHVCRTTGLDPFRRQIYMIGRNTKVTEWVDTPNGGRRKEERFVTKYTIQTGIDGYRRNVREAAKTLGDDVRFDGPWFTAEDDFHITEDGEVIQHWRKVWPKRGHPHAARFVVYRNGEEFEGVAHYDEFVQTNYQGEPNSMWAKMPRNQIAKCAEALAYRRAYPDDLSGLVLEDAAQPTVIDQDGRVVGQGRSSPRAQKSAPATVNEIFAEEVPVPQQAAAPSDIPSKEFQASVTPETPAGAAEADVKPTATADPAPAEQSAPKKAPAKKAAAKAAASRDVSKYRAPLEKRLFGLLGDAKITQEDRERDDRLAIYRAILGRADIDSTNDLSDVEVTKVGDQLYAWQNDNKLDEEIAGILDDAAQAAEDAAKQSTTTEGE